jgi:hypothetical protein
MEPESSLPYPQVPATYPYPEPAPSSPHNPLPLPESLLILSSHQSDIYIRWNIKNKFLNDKEFRKIRLSESSVLRVGLNEILSTLSTLTDRFGWNLV